MAARVARKTFFFFFFFSDQLRARRGDRQSAKISHSFSLTLCVCRGFGDSPEALSCRAPCSSSRTVPRTHAGHPRRRRLVTARLGYIPPVVRALARVPTSSSHPLTALPAQRRAAASLPATRGWTATVKEKREREGGGKKSAPRVFVVFTAPCPNSAPTEGGNTPCCSFFLSLSLSP